MNHIYRTVFNRTLGVWQAVAEIARGRGKGGRPGTAALRGAARRPAARAGAVPQAAETRQFRTGLSLAGCLHAALALGVPALALLPSAPAAANPTGGQVVAGAAGIANSGKTLTVTQSSQRAVINWHGFSIGAGEAARFNLPSASAAILNRVTGGNPSVLLGKLSSNGQVYLINPAGVVVGPHGAINTATFVASTLDLPNSAFMGGDTLSFAGGSTAHIVNLGTIQTSAGDVALIALDVVNKGSISAPQGQTILAAGSQVLYAPNDGSDVLIQPAAAPGAAGGQGSIDNQGTIAAAKVQLRAAGSAYALAVNNGGAISATAVHSVGGQVVLDGGAGDVVSSGTVEASGAGNVGGDMRLAGGRVAVSGVLDASGLLGGGSITLAAGQDISVTRSAQLRADATALGDGGRVSIKAAGTTQFDGTASARGGAQGGNGGNAEVSGGTLGFTGRVDLTAAEGKAGSLLFDPDSITVDDSATPFPDHVLGGAGTYWDYSDDPGAQKVSASAVVAQLDLGNVELEATRDITVNAPIVSATTYALGLYAPTVNVNADISLPNGSVRFDGSTTVSDSGGIDGGGSGTEVPGVWLGTASGTTISADNISVGSFDQTSLKGAVQAGQVWVNQRQLAASTFSATNPDNRVGLLGLGDGYGDADTYRGYFLFSTGGALSVEGMANATGSMSITSTGDLTMVANPDDVSRTQLGSSGGQITLASTQGAFVNKVGSGLFSGTGRRVIYSATDDGAFTQGGLGFAEITPVAYGSDPYSSGTRMVYLASSTKLPVMVISANSATRYYGQNDPAFTASYSGGLGSYVVVKPQFSVQGSDVAPGTYTVQPYGAVAANYRIVYQNGTLTVAPAPLTITGNSVTLSYDGTLPTLTGTFSGLALGDTPSSLPYSFYTSIPLATKTGASGLVYVAGVYPIGLDGVDPNYSVTYVPGSVTVKPAATINTLSSLLADPSSPFSSLLNGSDTIYTGAISTDKAITVDKQTITPVADWLGLGNDAMSIESDIVQSYVDAMAGSDPPVTFAQIEGLLLGTSAQALTLKGTLLPLAYAQLSTILDIPENQWTTAQRSFVAGIQTLIQEQRQQAAIKAENDYAAWEQQQSEIMQEKLAGLTGPAYYEMSAILSANPPVPPDSFLQTAQGGLSLTAAQTVQKMVIEAIAGSTVQAAVAAGEGGSAADGASKAGDAIATGGEVLWKIATARAIGDQEVSLQSGLKAILGPEVSKKIFPSNYRGKLLAKSGANAEGTDVAAITEAETKAEVQVDVKVEETVSEVVKSLDAISEGGEDAVKAVQALSSLMESAGEFLGPVGLALELAGNVMQAVTGAVEYAQIGSYNTAFKQAVEQANKSVSVSDLKAMLGNSTGQQQVMGYLSAGIAINGELPPPTVATKSLNQILNYF